MNTNEKPNMQKFGYHEQNGFDDQPSGWMFEGGEEEYYKALNNYHQKLKTDNLNKILNQFKNDEINLDETNILITNFFEPIINCDNCNEPVKLIPTSDICPNCFC